MRLTVQNVVSLAKMVKSLEKLTKKMENLVVSRKYHKEKTNCPVCGKSVIKYKLKRHYKTKFCKWYKKHWC